MGKSDPIIFSEYLKVLNEDNHDINSVAFLGFDKENLFTKSIKSSTRHFYDLNLKNWNINDDWSLKQQYDLIVCTRCPYFSKDPYTFVKKCLENTNNKGHILLDWGLGDHWRFKNYKVGWIRNGEHEFAYYPDNFLYSCYWNDDLSKDKNVSLFWDEIKTNPTYGYNIKDNLNDIIKKEVPCIVDYKTKKIKTVYLWPESPQLYIITLIEKQ